MSKTTENTGSILDLNFDDVYEPELWDDGDEVDMTIKKVVVGPTKNGLHNMITLTLWDPADHKKQPIIERMVIPNKADQEEDPAAYNRSKARIQSMSECFDVQTNGVVPADEWPGATGSVIVRLEESEQYGKQNSVKKFVVGH